VTPQLETEVVYRDGVATVVDQNGYPLVVTAPSSGTVRWHRADTEEALNDKAEPVCEPPNPPSNEYRFTHRNSVKEDRQCRDCDPDHTPDPEPDTDVYKTLQDKDPDDVPSHFRAGGGAGE
jgi:hypothetical protein